MLHEALTARADPLHLARVFGLSHTTASRYTLIACDLLADQAGQNADAASWLVMDGVPVYDVQALLGHESYRTTERYAHLAPDPHDKVVQSWARRHEASVTHGRKLRTPFIGHPCWWAVLDLNQ